jgi:hypothetical protein
MSQSASDSSRSRFYFGLEQDVLPYILKGFIATGWVGRNHVRCRLSYAEATKPKFVLPENISVDRVHAFGISFEYFTKEKFKGLWVGPGIGLWNNYFKDNGTTEGKYQSLIFTIGSGYNLSITNWLYFSPWVALHTRIGGTNDHKTGMSVYTPAIITPEVSIKLGIKLSRRSN